VASEGGTQPLVAGYTRTVVIAEPEQSTEGMAGRIAAEQWPVRTVVEVGLLELGPWGDIEGRPSQTRAAVGLGGTHRVKLQLGYIVVVGEPLQRWGFGTTVVAVPGGKPLVRRLPESTAPVAAAAVRS